MDLSSTLREEAMSLYGMRGRSAAAVACLVAAGILGWGAEARSDMQRQERSERARIVLAEALPKMDGEHLKATLVEVKYGPGESSAPHSHPCPVIGYVVAGTLRTQVRGEVEAVYKAGESFYEAANGVHAVSANASATEPAKLIAYFVCDHDAPLSVAASEVAAPGGK
jgi:quercetin dioxygenase-like cupin family protein